MSNFKFEILAGDTVRATLLDCTGDTKLVFPAVYKGKKISTFVLTATIVGEKLVKEIVFEDGIKTLCKLKGRFRGCEKIIIGEGAKKIPPQCFAYMYSLKNVCLSRSIEVIQNKVFYNSRQLQSIKIPKGACLTYIYPDAFSLNEAYINQSLLSGCNKYYSYYGSDEKSGCDGYYLPSEDNPYFFLYYTKNISCHKIHQNCELFYEIYGSNYHKVFKLRDVISLVRDTPSILKMDNAESWCIEGNRLKCGKTTYSLDSTVEIKYQAFMNDDIRFLFGGFRAWQYYSKHLKFNRDEAVLALSYDEYKIKRLKRIGVINIGSRADLFNMVSTDSYNLLYQK